MIENPRGPGGGNVQVGNVLVGNVQGGNVWG